MKRGQSVAGLRPGFIARTLVAFVFVLITAMHPYFVGVTEVKIDPKTKAVAVSCKLFVDDVQDAIFQQTQQRINLATHRPADQKLLNDYMQGKMKLYWGSTPIALKMVGYDIEEEGVWCFFEAHVQGKAKQVEICNRALYETLEGQTHFLHFTYGTQTQHWKITNPEGCHRFGLQ